MSHVRNLVHLALAILTPFGDSRVCEFCGHKSAGWRRAGIHLAGRHGVVL